MIKPWRWQKGRQGSKPLWEGTLSGGAPQPSSTASFSVPRLLGEKRQELLDQANKLRTGLFKIDETREKVEVMSLELEDAKKKVAEFQKQCEEYLVIIVQQKREADEQQKVASHPPPVLPLMPLCYQCPLGREASQAPSVTMSGDARSTPQLSFSFTFYCYHQHWCPELCPR